MNKENDVKATTNSGRMFEYCVFQNPGLLVLCPDSAKVAAGRKNKETHRLFIFFTPSKEQGNLSGNPKIPCSARQLPFHPLPMVAASRSQWTTFSLMCPMVAFRGCPPASLRETGVVGTTLLMVDFRFGFPLETDICTTVSGFHNLKILCYGKEE